MSKKILGLDIRHDAISAILVKSGIKGNWIEAVEYIPFSGQNDIQAQLTSALETLKGAMDINGTVCVASFPANLASYRELQSPFKDQKKIRQILPFELEPTLPFPVEDIIIDFYSLKASAHAEHTDIIAAAIEQSKMKSYLDTLAAFKLDPKIVSVGGYPAAICMTTLASFPEKCLFMDIDSQQCAVFIIFSGQLCMMRSFSVHSDPENRIQSIQIGIQQTLAAYDEISSIDFQPDEIRMTGYGLLNDGLEEKLEKAAEIPVRRINLKHDTGIMLKTIPGTPRWEPVQTDNALALALLEIEGIGALNFRRDTYALKKEWMEHKQSFIRTGILAGLLLLVIGLNIFSDVYLKKKKLNSLDSQITSIFKSTFPDKKIVDPLHQMQVAMQDLKKTALHSAEPERNIRSIDILNEISKSIPKEINVDLSRLVIGDDNVQITGDTDTFNSVDDIKNRLEKTEMFKKVTISSANQEKSGNRVQFKLKVEL